MRRTLLLGFVVGFVVILGAPNSPVEATCFNCEPTTICSWGYECVTASGPGAEGDLCEQTIIFINNSSYCLCRFLGWCDDQWANGEAGTSCAAAAETQPIDACSIEGGVGFAACESNSQMVT